MYKRVFQKKATQLAGKRIFLNQGDDALVKIKLKAKLFMRNLMTNTTAYTLLRLLSQLRGRAFKFIIVRAEMREVAIINPAIFECFSDKPLDIRCTYLLLDSVPCESMQRSLKTVIKSKRLCLWKLDIDATYVQQLFEFIAMGKKWCASLRLHEINAPSGFIDMLIEV